MLLRVLVFTCVAALSSAKITSDTPGFGGDFSVSDDLILIGKSLHSIGAGFPHIKDFPDPRMVAIGNGMVPGATTVLNWVANSDVVQVYTHSGNKLSSPKELKDTGSCAIKSVTGAGADGSYIVYFGTLDDDKRYMMCVWRLEGGDKLTFIKAQAFDKSQHLLTNHDLATSVTVSSNPSDVMTPIFVAAGFVSKDATKSGVVVGFKMIPVTTDEVLDLSIKPHLPPITSASNYPLFGKRVSWGRRPDPTKGAGLLLPLADDQSVNVKIVNEVGDNDFLKTITTFNSATTQLTPMRNVSAAASMVEYNGAKYEAVVVGVPSADNGNGVVQFYTKKYGTSDPWSPSGMEENVVRTNGSSTLNYGACVGFDGGNFIWIGEPGAKQVLVHRKDALFEGDLRAAESRGSMSMLIFIAIGLCLLLVVIGAVAGFVIWKKTRPGPDRNVASYDDEYFKGERRGGETRTEEA